MLSYGLGVDSTAILRRWMLDPTLPTTEHFLVAAPAVVDDKEHAKFDNWWDDLNADLKPLTTHASEPALV